MGLKKIDKQEIPKAPDEIRLFAVVQNEELRLPYVIDFYKKLGVDRFFFVDNKSTDTTQEVLLSHDNVHVFYTAEGFGGKHGWKDSLLRKYGVDHWCLIIDADELLIYPDYETKSLKDLCGFMDVEGSNVLRSFLLDMYSTKKLREAVLKQGQDPMEVLDHFDLDAMMLQFRSMADSQRGYLLKYKADNPDLIYGGMRRRVLNHHALLNKACLFKFDKSMNVMTGHHFIEGHHIKSSSIRTVVLHTKHSADFVEMVNREAERQIYWNEGAEYRMFKDAGVADNPFFTFKCDASCKFVDSQQLVNVGLMRSNPLFGYKGWDRLPTNHTHEGITRNISKNSEKVNVLIDLVKNYDFKSIIDTSLNGGYNSCMILNNVPEDTKVYSFGEDTEANKDARLILADEFDNLECRLSDDPLTEIRVFYDEIDFCFLDGVTDYFETHMMLEHILKLLKKDGIILINNLQFKFVADAVAGINWVGFSQIPFRTNANYPVLCMQKNTNQQYVAAVSLEEKAREKKYIGIGLSETGFNKVRDIFEMCNFEVDSFIKPDEMHRLDIVQYVDNLPMCNMFEEIDAKYDAKFIYTKLELGDWLQRCKKHWDTMKVSSLPHSLKGVFKKYRTETYGTEAFEEHKFREKYLSYDKKVMDYFKGNMHKLLVVNPLEDKNLAKKVISFIGLQNIPEK